MAVEINLSNTIKAIMTAQRHTEPIDNPKPTTGHFTALQRDKIQLHQPEHSHKLPQLGKHQRTLTQQHQWEQMPQPRRTMTLRISFYLFLFSYKSHYLCFSIFPFLSFFTLYSTLSFSLFNPFSSFFPLLFSFTLFFFYQAS